MTEVSLQEYQKRRDRLMSMMSPGSIALIPGAKEKRRNRDIHYPFRQDSDFYYLSGFREPETLLVLIPGRLQGQEVLFCRERNVRGELYDGERLGPERACRRLLMDDAFPIADIEEIVPGLLEGRDRIYINLGDYPEFDKQLLGWVADIRARESSGAHPPGEFVELKHLLHELRLVKSATELTLMRKACTISVDAHLRAMRNCRPGMSEGQIEAELTYTFMKNGARCAAYPSIVGSGKNACVLHYIENTGEVAEGDLVLIDAGCEYEYYAADITRTIPANGSFTGPQRTLYEIVLAANLAAIEKCKPGAHFNEPHEAALVVMVDGLLDQGLLEGERDVIMTSESYQPFIPHKTSHWLGIDVHDVGDYRFGDSWRELEPGMVLTIEPGIYIPRIEANQHLPEKFLGIGIRVEDDVLITQHGCEVLSAGVPKTPAELEAIMAENPL